MSQYKPMLIATDEEGFKEAIASSKERIEVYKKAFAFASEHIDVTNGPAFADSFTAYFKEKYEQQNPELGNLGVGIDKMLYLKDIDIQPLATLEANYKRSEAPILFQTPDSLPKPNVQRKTYELYTKSSEENERLRAGRKFLESLEALAKHTKVYPMNIQSATSNMIRFNMRTQEYVVNI